MRYEIDPRSPGPHERVLAGTAALLGVLWALAIGALFWASEDHGTNCHADTYRSAGDTDPVLHPIVAGCTFAALALTVVLLVLSSRRRASTGAPGRRPGVPSALVAFVTAWCAAVYLQMTFTSAHVPTLFGSTHGLPEDPLSRMVALPPQALLFVVAVPVVFLQYTLFLPPPILLTIALTRRTLPRRYAIMQLTVIYALLACIAVAIGSAFLLTGFCLGD